MLDTIKATFSGELRVQMPERRWLALPSGSGVRVIYRGSGDFCGEVSLPRLLHGSNGVLLASQSELNSGIEKFRTELATVAKFDAWKWTLLDLVWQFTTRAADVILAHQWLRFDGVRSLPSLMYGGKEISWRGANSRLSVKMYDKAKALRAGEGVLRAELRLAGHQLRRRIDTTAPLNFAELWRVYRDELSRFAPVALPQARKHGFAAIFAGLATEARSTALLRYRQGRTAKAVRDFERHVSEAALESVPWNWREILPPDSPPPPVNVCPPATCGRTARPCCRGGMPGSSSSSASSPGG